MSGQTPAGAAQVPAGPARLRARLETFIGELDADAGAFGDAEAAAITRHDWPSARAARIRSEMCRDHARELRALLEDL